MGSSSARLLPSSSPSGQSGWRRTLSVFDFQLTDEEMVVSPLDTGASLFFDHRDPEMVSRIGNVRGT